MSNHAPSERRLQRRRLRLIAELADEGVDLQLLENDPLFSVVIEEIAYARQPPVHEGRRSSYGALVSDTPERLALLAENREPLPAGRRISLRDAEPEGGNVDYIRKMCNGRTTFLVRSMRGPEYLLELNPEATEQGLAQLVSANVRVIQRTPGGAVKVFTPTHVYVFEHGEWRAKIFASDAASMLEQIFFPDGPSSAVEVLSELLSFSLHILSSRHIGATFVWFPNPSYPRLSTSRFDGQLPPALLHTNHRPHAEPLATLLAAIDGACFVGPTGQIEFIEVKLPSTARATSLIAAEGGLRHTSAKRYSFDNPSCIIFVVSHDGPVTVYSDGMSVLQLRAGPSYASSIDGVAQHDIAQHDIFGSRRPKPCPHCDKELMVERVHGRHKDRPMSIDCPICDYADLESDNAVAMHAWPRKPWTNWGVGAWLPK
jgi:DNA integrity scanning protein DisA with diadenylate cyclase activity